MKYFVAIFVTAVVIFLAATVYYKGLPTFSTPNGVSVTSQEILPTPSPTQTANQNASIVSAVQAAIIAERGQGAASLTITVSKVEGDYAQGGASASGGGAMWFAAKVDDVWKLVWDGNGQINCSNLTQYPLFPKDMIPECWDTVTNKIVIR